MSSSICYLAFRQRFLTILLAAAWSASPLAGDFGISPLDVEFSPQRKSEVLTITSGDRDTISLRIHAMRWTQDASGKDLYEESPELIFFPRRIDLPPGEKRILRVGVNTLFAGPERAYRLFVEEIAPPETPLTTGTRLAVLVSIGVPVFVSQGTNKAEVQIDSAILAGDGHLKMAITNTGDRRLRLSRITATDGTMVSENIPSRYIFPGIRKQFDIMTTHPACTAGRLPLKLDADGTFTDIDATCAN